MKKAVFLLSILFSTFSAFSQEEQILKNGKINIIKAFKNDSLDFFIIDRSALLFKAPKGKINLAHVNNYFEKLSYDETGNILNLTPSKIKFDNFKQIIFSCKPIEEETGSSKKYSFEEIEKCFEIVKKLSLDWKNKNSCDQRADDVFRELHKLNYTTLTVIAMVGESMEKCYAPKNESSPIWLYHIAKVMQGNDYKYYVLDLCVSPNGLIELSEWKNSIQFGEKDCEKFELYTNNCRVKSRLLRSNKFHWTVECSCEPLSLQSATDNN